MHQSSIPWLAVTSLIPLILTDTALSDLESSSSLSSEGGNIVVTEWARGPAVANGVGLSLDDHGRAYVTTAARRKQSSLDIRHHQDLVKQDLSWQTVEDRRQFYRSYLDGQKWLPDRNDDGKRDWRDLTVQKDTVTLVTDRDGDGTGESIRVFDEYHSEVTGIAAGVLALGSDLFVAVEPDFLRYTDEDGDGIPERETLVTTGLQVHMGQGGHNLSGVALGPDGRVYWSLADKGHHVITKEGRTYHRPNSGAIFRCEMDGTQVERYSTGERNAQELAFDDHGNLFSMDNDGDYPGEMERALYITEGSEHGWRLNWQWLRKQDFTKISGLDAYNPWMEERLYLPDHETHAAYLTPTLGNFGPGPCGFTKNPGTALSAELTDCFFMTNQQSQVRVFKFHPKGAFFSFEELAPMKGGVNNTGLAIGPDGALYAASYGGNRGSIFRFDVGEGDRHPLRAETQRILASRSETAAADTLVAWLDHPDQRVRLKGQFELVRRGETDRLGSALREDAATLLGRLHAIWGIGQLARREPQWHSLLEAAWKSGEEELMAQAAKVLGEIPGGVEIIDREARGFLVTGLDHSSARVPFFCAIAVGRLGDRQAAPAVIELLASRGASDAYLRHAAVMGLAGTLTSAQLAELHDHSSRAVRLGAIVALRRQAAPEVAAFLDDRDELLLLEAARAIHDDQSIAEALPELSALLDRQGLQSEALMRRVINAAFRDGSATSLGRLVRYLKQGEGTVKLRRTALASILWWSQPPVLDPVEGRYRKHAPRDSAVADQAVAELKSAIVDDRDLLEVLLNGVVERGQAQWLEGLDGEEALAWPEAHQALYLEALAKTKSPHLKEVVERGLDSSHAGVREKAREHASAAGVPLVDVLIAVLDDPSPAGQGKAVLQLAKLDGPRAEAKLEELAARYRAGEAEPAWKLELWQAATSKGLELPETSDRLEYGGDPKRGRKLVMEHAAAQCVRCHQIGREAKKIAQATVGIGPDLTQIGGKRDRAHLVASLMTPTSEISEGYGTILLTTEDGTEIAGVLSKKTESEWVVTLPEGNNRSIDPQDVREHTLTSAMPPVGLLMKPEEIRDVVSYLATLK